MINKEELDVYVGKPLEEMVTSCLAKGQTVRVMLKDGNSCLGTCDFRPNRINVAIKNNIVTEIRGIG